MSRKGPLPFPVEIKRARGTLRKDRTNPREPAALPVGRAVPPAWLSPEGVAAWGRLLRLLKTMRVLGGQDLELLAVFADQVGVYEQAALMLREKGALSFVVLDADGSPKGVSAFPEVKIKAAAASEIRRLCEHFGLSPAARAKVAAIEPEGAADDAAAMRAKYFGA